MITTAAHCLVASLHDRIPVILSREDEGTWLNPAASPAQALACLQPFPAHLLRITPVSPKVHLPTYHAPDLLQRVTHDGPGGALHERETAAEAGLFFPDIAPV
jgi:putative SOS response-associated peptidase YedK